MPTTYGLKIFSSVSAGVYAKMVMEHLRALLTFAATDSDVSNYYIRRALKIFESMTFNQSTNQSISDIVDERMHSQRLRLCHDQNVN